MNILITGGTGFVGQELVPFLLQQGHAITILTRDNGKVAWPQVTAIESLDRIENGAPIEAIINLAGAPIDKRWTVSYKQKLIDSRVQTTEALVALVARLENKPIMMINASAIGYYGAHDNTPLDETALANDEFTHQLCYAWESAARKVEAYGVRLCITRLGVVLGKGGGALKRMLPAFKLGVGGKLGDGKQIMSWVQCSDVVRAFDFLLQHKECSGIYNLTAPNAVSNSEFTKALGKELHRPTIFTMPAFMVKTLFGEMGDRLLLHGQNVIPAQLSNAGFEFNFPTIEEALKRSL